MVNSGFVFQGQGKVKSGEGCPESQIGTRVHLRSLPSRSGRMKAFQCALLLFSILIMAMAQEEPNTGAVMRKPPLISRCCLYGWYDCCGYLFGQRYAAVPPQYQYPPLIPVANPISNYII
ncbi:uncharacterized protein CEXT_737401 [Caerostris extrusa]|uniref:Uncharacterized protein n=1 Tax=Caerostris extrusa TaxID=172846 RepID=A0AAV4XKX8_CAEEX|nr:uncharacterized protein CEXT_737401 [Caerostris extrusa]